MVYDPYQILLAIQFHAEIGQIMQRYAKDYSSGYFPGATENQRPDSTGPEK